MKEAYAATSKIRKWKNRRKEFDELTDRESKRRPMQIEVLMRVKMRGPDRPVCAECNHSVLSHGEEDGHMICWACRAVNKKCEKQTTQTSRCVK